MFDPTRGAARESLDRNEVARLRNANALVLDGRLRRPFYFDGRFLTAQDLTREQTYFLTRQADLGRAGGFGVVAGLAVTPGRDARSLRIAAGHGVTPLGELVVLPDPVDVDLADLPAIQRLNAAFGLATIPQEVARNRTGIFVVALRPVEYTANPIASYPTSITGQRTVEDSEIVEAVAVSLIPYQDSGLQEDAGLRRAQLAWRIFVAREGRELPAGVLPLAMVALNRGIVDWIDMYLVRREVGPEQQDILGLGYAPRALREAHVQHHNSLMAELVRAAAGNPAQLRFAAVDRFRTLPPVGRLPAAAVADDFAQIFFPPEINVDLSFVPEDELPALIEEGLMLPPIDLTLRGDDQESTSVLLLLPALRSQVHRLSMQLEGTLSRGLRPAAPGLVASRKPLEVLRGIRLPRSLPPVIDPQNQIDAIWRTALAGQETLWYVRRRNLNFAAAVVGLAIEVTPDGPSNPVEPPVPVEPTEPAEPTEPVEPTEPAPGPPVPDALAERLAEFQLRDAFERVIRRATPDGRQAIVDLLLQAQIAKAAGTTEAVITDLSLAGEGPIDADAVAAVAKRFRRTDLGNGLNLLRKVDGRLQAKEAVANLVVSGQLPEIDGLGRTLQQIMKRVSSGAVPQMPMEEASKRLTQELGEALMANGAFPERGALLAHRAHMAEFVPKAAEFLGSLL